MKESNVSNLTRTLAVLSLLAPASAYPLGVGEIKLHSALNQNLDAEISLMLSAGERISDVKVSLAPPDKFDERGVPWSYFLSNISFEPAVRPDGSAVIKVRSREALKEPILDLLLQVTWPKGTSYRQFSLMVDPPAAYVQPVVPVTRVPETIASAPIIPAPTAPVTPSYAPEPRPVIPDSAAMAPNPVRRVPKDDIVKGVYGPTRQNDTLWTIAEKASRPYKVSVEQMMIAIYQANPQAFYKDNVNALLAKVKLKIPEREAVVKLSHQEALAEYNRQREAWKNRSQPVSSEVAKAVRKQETPAEKPIDNQLTLAAPAEANVAEKAVITPGQEQNAVKSEADKAEAGTAGDKANGEMQERMAALEQQLAKMQAILAIKEQQLAALQDQVQQASKASAAPAQPLPAEQAAASVQPAQPAPPIAAVQPNVADEQPVKPTTPAIVQEQPALPPHPPEPAAVKKPVPRSAPAPEPVEEPLPLDLIGIGGAGIAALLGLFWWRRRKMAGEASLNTESMFSPSIIYKAPESDSTFSVPALNESTAYDVNPVGESSFLSEFTPSDFDAFDSDQGEIDPISEADVYLAYGRYQQAEELMRNAVTNYPDRDECKLKLLEIYYAAENKSGFEAFAKELSAAGKGQDNVFWGKAAEMGREICPDSALFALQSAPASNTDGSVTGKTEAVSLAKQDVPGQDDFDMPFDADFEPAAFDTSEFDASFTKISESPQASAPVVDQDFADFDLEGFSFDETAEQDEPRNNESIDFDLDKLPGLAGESEVQESQADSADLQFSPAADKEFDFEPLDFDTGFSAAEKNKQDDEILALAIEDQFNLTKEADDDKPEIALGDDFNFDFDFSTLGNDEAEDDPLEMTGVADLTDMDELETKLDLARAYRDMGDNESARDIVSEVLEKGSAEQKKLAQVLLNELM
ncbi:FimV/HubP family polar landmark protein [Candidatus Methylomicrobium oryzae]|uniref:FimV/HubP family polar landmark protein n=1 Tax=Candidatus Methylomicrobium oryzae TaxID=2802053 RepID=UPI003019DC25